MPRVLRSKLFWAFFAAKFIVSAIFLSSLLPASAKTLPAASAQVVRSCPVAQTTLFSPAKYLPFPVSFAIPSGWSAVWHHRPGVCVGEACVVSTMELSPGYVYDADHLVLRHSGTIRLSVIGAGSLTERDEVASKLMESIHVTGRKTTLLKTHKLTTVRGLMEFQEKQVPTRDYIIHLEKEIVHISLETVTPESEKGVQAILTSMKDRS